MQCDVINMKREQLRKPNKEEKTSRQTNKEEKTDYFKKLLLSSSPFQVNIQFLNESIICNVKCMSKSEYDQEIPQSQTADQPTAS